MKWYKVPVWFIFRTCFASAISVSLRGTCKSSCRSAYFRFVTLFLLKKTRQSARSGVTGTLCLRPWLTRALSRPSRFGGPGDEPGVEVIRFCVYKRLPSTTGNLVALLWELSQCPRPHINYRNEAKLDTYFVPVQKKVGKSILTF